MPHRENFDIFLNMPEDHAILSNAQAVAPVPLAPHRLNIPGGGFAEAGDTL
jgi:hypothetical protein